MVTYGVPFVVHFAGFVAGEIKLLEVFSLALILFGIYLN